MIERVLATGAEPEGLAELLSALAERGIPLRRGTRVVGVCGASRLESVTLEHDGTREIYDCDLLVASPRIVSE